MAGSARSSPGRWVGYAVLVAAGGALVFAVLAGPLALGAGLVIVAAAIGRFIGLALQPAARTGFDRRRAGAAAVVLAGTAVIVGEIATWLYARAEGGVLSLPEYVAAVHGPIAPLGLLLAAAAAWWTAR